MIKKLSIFIGILLIVGFFIIYQLFNYNLYLKDYFEKSNKILSYIDTLKARNYKLNYLVLKTSFYLYENNDKVIREINNIDSLIKEIKKDTFFKNNFPLAYNDFLEFEKIYKSEKENIYRFLMFNSIIKNATIYLSRILSDSIIFGNDKEFLKKEIDTISKVLVAKSSFDESLLENLNIDFFKKIHFKDKNKEKIKDILVANLILFKRFFHKYSFYLNQIQNSKVNIYLDSILKNYYLEKKEKIKKLQNIFLFIIFVLLGGIAIVSYLLYLINKEHLLLENSFVTDNLTSLGNREKFNRDLKNYKNPILYLININKFKHINDIYGTKVGDELLKKVGLILKNNFDCRNKNVYRLGSDDFALLCEGEMDYQKIIDYFKNHPIVIDGKEFNISVSIGISKEAPLIENADMALKMVKKDSKLTSLVYSSESNLKNIYKENLNKSKLLQEAIKKDLIVPVFQPIFYNNSLNICKYEVLARIKTENGLISIFPFLEVAKENKVYKEITKIIYLKTYDVFKDNSLNFSLNLSIDDILEDETLDLIDTLFKDKNFASRCTFELLESEAIKDYNIVKEFIDKMKKIGVKFAIDDFGSGYSNFEHVLNLEIDYLKIDGSLIKKIEDKNTQIIVETINNFAKKMNIITVAEFVSSKEIFEIVKSLNIDCSQGYYLSEPLEEIDFTKI